MRTTIVGAGPSGTTAALLLARAGHDVTLVDRDAGPGTDGTWDRVGVMQFLLPQGLRGPGRLFLESRLPDVHQALLDAGAAYGAVPRGAPPFTAGLHLRRCTMERVLWACADREPGITRRTGHADGLVRDGDRVTGVVVDGEPVSADLVVDASGKAGRLGHELRPEAQETAAPFAYVAREYRLLPGAEPGPIEPGPGLAIPHDGFMEMVFVQDGGTFQTLVVRSTDDHELALLREEAAHTAASALLPGIATWTAAERAEPIGPVRAGAGLVNRFHRQPTDVTGLLAIGDALLVTNPMAARGLSLGMAAAGKLADTVATLPAEEWAGALDAWARAELLPWYDDHCAVDATMHARWRHEPLTADGPIGWDVIADAAHDHPDWMPVIGPYFGMFAQPSVLEPVREQIRAQLRDGWQPRVPGGLTRDELAGVVRAAVAG
ncbi:FAD-dependent oxidoreductase [Nocardioides kongjuensis]|uniref:2-polyprenyl-6-methoxyphenol hydroxylase-like FAD-dependent oxidoreductase n=1 Tax=Nocardioides kongjuensis TaxID=349522 RepID=A0A852RLI5_9ACTN|nr:FAD-dependent oxidoreductase [Nocardioides kongjuensis]NYD31905.1 2-polyprenyl-6-methoxyphenol hydroxylase-like FAD-dependent oxidoreductase [Nocardioides kongjuensis]